MDPAVSPLLVAVGAAVGAPLRYLVDRAIQARLDSFLPWGTLIVNVSGSLVLGVLIALPAGPAWTALFGTGFCGALTTYSTFSYETMRLLQSGQYRSALLYAAGSVGAGSTAAVAGYAVAASAIR